MIIICVKGSFQVVISCVVYNLFVSYTYFFLFKQKTAYDMRISDWSSDVCSSDLQLRDVDAWWRAANYLSVGQIYLRANPLLREPLALAHVKRSEERRVG